MLTSAMAVIETMNPDWDLVKLFTERAPRSHGVSVGPFRLFHPAILPARTVGYAVSRRGARKLLASKERFARPLDMDLKHWWEKDLRVLVIQPSVLALAASHASTSALEPERRLARSNRFRRFFRNLEYQLRFRVSLVRALLGRAGRCDLPGRSGEP
jgi:glycosyl transferase family 25